jgi:hypothetical protein
MNEDVTKIVEALKEMGFRVVALEDKTYAPYPVISISVVNEKWAEANCQHRGWKDTDSNEKETL